MLPCVTRVVITAQKFVITLRKRLRTKLNERQKIKINFFVLGRCTFKVFKQKNIKRLYCKRRKNDLTNDSGRL